MGSGRIRRQLTIAAAIYLLVTICVLAMAPRQRLVAHTPYNHYALQAEAWLRGRLDLGGPPPPYTGNNDFAQLNGKHYVSFPPVPSVLLLPVVAYAGSVERVRDGQFFYWLAGIGPALLFLVLERLRRSGRSRRSELENALLSVKHPVDTNIVIFDVAAPGTGDGLLAYLADREILAVPFGPGQVRMVPNLETSAAHIDRAIAALNSYTG